jgi:uncharacterized repeat protein (TIGR01451 family)
MVPGLVNDVVNLPVGATITYTINVNIAGGASGDLVHTATVTLPAGYNETGSLPNSVMDTNTALLPVDLQITKSDAPVVLYSPGQTLTYTIRVSNLSGPNNVSGAIVTDNIPMQITSWDWACINQNGASGCDGMSGNTDFSDVVDLPVGGWIDYTVTALTSTSLGGNLTNTADVTVPAGYIDLGPLPSSASDTDVPWIGTSPDGNYYDLPIGAQLILDVNLVANGDAGPDFVYYEVLNNGSPDYILLDQVRIEIGDGANWYTVFDWGDGLDDSNSSVSGLNPGIEQDEFPINEGPPLYNNGSGVAIDIDNSPIQPVPLGTYIYIRITSSPHGPGIDSTTDIDAVQILP